MTLSDINKKIILSISLVLVANAFAVGALWFINMKIKDMNSRVTVIKREMSLREKEDSEAKVIKSNLLNFSPWKEKLDAVFIGQKDVLSFIKEIETLAKESGVEMEFRSVDISKNNNEEKPIFQFKATGSFPDVFHYLVLLENIKYQIIFDNISFQERGLVGSGDDAYVKWEAVFSVRLLSYN